MGHWSQNRHGETNWQVFKSAMTCSTIAESSLEVEYQIPFTKISPSPAETHAC